MLKPISCFWLACFVFATLASLVISDSSNNDERANGNVEARRPKSREWLEQMKAEAQKHPSNHPTLLATRDIVSDIKARSFSLFSSSSSSSSSSEGKGFKKMMKRQRKMNKRARKHGGRYSPYGYNPQRFSGGYSGGRYPGAYPGGGGRFSGGYPGGGRFSGGYPGGNYGIGGNYGLGGGGGFSAIPAY